MEALMGGSKKTVEKKDNTLDPFSQQMITSAVGNINQLTGQEYTPYTGQRVAGIGDLQRDSLSNYIANDVSNRGLVEQGLTMAQRGADYTPSEVQAQSFTDADISGYMNPYMENVIGNALSDIERKEMASAENIDAQASKASAFGGSRQAIQQAENTRNFAEIAAKTAAELRSQGYEDAANRVQADAQRQMQADLANQAADMSGAELRMRGAGQIADMAGQLSDSDLRRLGVEQEMGALERQVEQERLAAEYEQFMNAYNDRYRRANAQISILGGTPQVVDSTSTVTQTGGPGIGGLLGDALGSGMFNGLLGKIGKKGGN
jgi:hypothetical protein